MRRNTTRKFKNKLRKYTALVPKTVKATRSMGTMVVKKINYFLKDAKSTLKRGAKSIDRRTAKSIRSLTKRNSRK
jgi:hypothetical protein